MIRALTIALFVFMAASCAYAQDGTDSARADTTRTMPPAAAVDSTTPRYVMTKSPLAATLYSLIPGGGQFYNEQYWKVPLFLGGTGFFVGRAIYLNAQFNTMSDSADNYQRGTFEYQFFKARREFYRDGRDENIAYGVGVLVLGMIDAYVGAHMFDFDVSDDKTSHIILNPTAPGIGLALRW